MMQKGKVWYSLPNENHFYTVEGPVTEVNTDVITEKMGFIFAPFDREKWPVFRIQGQAHQTNLTIDAHQLYLKEESVFEMSKSQYIQTIESLIQQIQQGELQKLVFSISKKSPLLDGDYATLLATLRKAYPNAFIYLWSTPETGTWLGASPELLLQRTAHELSTVALAGTLRNAPNLSDWGSKEIDEHRFVEEYIEAGIQDCHYTKEGPVPIQAGPVYHLSSTYRLDSKVNLSPLTLHPGPALSGTPVLKSVEKIHQLEGRSRRYYAGFLGYIAPDKTYQLFVNLRCMQILEKELALYAGGGITKDSQPEKEWAELQYKFSTLQSKLLKKA